MQTIRNRDFSTEWQITAVRSSGAGGQNVNKVNTKISLRFSIPNSRLLSNREKEILISRLKNRLTHKNELIIDAEESRSQIQNKEAATERFYALLEWGLRPVKKRIPTRPSKASKQKRLDRKKKLSEKKKRRRDDFI